MKKLLMTYMVLGLAGCSSLNSINPFEDKPITNPPAELVALGSQIPVSTLWSTKIGDGVDELHLKLVPKIDQGKVYTADRHGIVKSLSASSGALNWQHDLEEDITGGPGVGDGLVLLGSSNGELIALDQSTGKHQWRTRVSSEILSVPQAKNGVAVAYTIDGKLAGFSSKTGEKLWVYERKVPSLTLQGSSSPVIVANAVICGFANGKLAAVELTTGQLLWEATVSVPRGRTDLERVVDIDGDPLVRDGAVFVSTFQGEMAAIKVQTGEVAWRREFSSNSGMDYDRKQLYITDAEDFVWAIDPRNGSSLWKQDKLKGRQVSGPAVVGGYVVVGDFEGYLHWMSIEDGTMVARTRVGDAAITTAPVNVNGIIYVYGDGGQVAAISAPRN